MTAHGAAVINRVSTLALGGLLGLALMNLLRARRLERAAAPRSFPRVSLLIPARNEAVTLPDNLPAAARSEYEDLEVLVLDDQSTDGTPVLVEELASRDPRIRLVRGSTPPPGWLGKSWACQQLAERATGEVLIFCDADVALHPLAVTRTVGMMQQTGAGLLTALPRQITPSVLEAAIVPLIAQLPVLALLPLRLAESARSPRLAMGNGQWMAFTREAYRRAGGHASVRGGVLEDVALARIVKASGGRLVIVLGWRDLEVRMYRDAASLRQGFRKNLYALVGGRPLPFAVSLGTFGMVMLYPLAAPMLVRGAAGKIPLLLLLGLRLVGYAALGHSARGILLHPLGALLTGALAVDSARASTAGGVVWKGRPVGTRGGENMRLEAEV